MIPDDWEESVPFMCEIDKESFVSFLYWKPRKQTAEIKKMICINIVSGTIRALTASELTKMFKLDKELFSLPTIINYEDYYLEREQYETLFEKLCSSDKAFNEVGMEEFHLLSRIAGDDLLYNLFNRIAENYIKKLQIGI